MWMRYPGNPDSASKVDERSFRLVWAPRGWEEFVPDPPPPVTLIEADTPTEKPSPSRRTKDKE